MSEEPLDHAAIRDEVIRTLLEQVRSGKHRNVRHDCEYHPKYKPGNPGNFYHEIKVAMPDTASVQAAKELLDRLEGKAAAQKPKDEPPRFDAGNMDALSDAELDAIIAGGGVGVSTPDG